MVEMLDQTVVNAMFKEMTLPNSEVRWGRIVAPNGNVYFIPENVDNPADFIHVSTRNKEGYGGSTLTFNLTNGEVVKVEGPWHGNPHDLLANTGIDLHGKHLSWVAIGRKPLDGRLIGVSDVVYQDLRPVVGEFNRCEPLAEYWNAVLGVPVWVAQYNPGSACGKKVDLELSRELSPDVMKIHEGPRWGLFMVLRDIERLGCAITVDCPMQNLLTVTKTAFDALNTIARTNGDSFMIRFNQGGERIYCSTGMHHGDRETLPVTAAAGQIAWGVVRRGNALLKLIHTNT